MSDNLPTIFLQDARDCDGWRMSAAADEESLEACWIGDDDEMGEIYRKVDAEMGYSPSDCGSTDRSDAVTPIIVTVRPDVHPWPDVDWRREGRTFRLGYAGEFGDCDPS